MTNPMMYEQLDAAIGVLLTEPDAAVQAGDPEVRELLAIAAELLSAPRPEFRAALENELRYELGLPLRRPEQPLALPHSPEEALPTLFESVAATYPVRGRNFAISLAAHAAMLAVVLASALLVSRVVANQKQSSVALVNPALSEYAAPVGDGKLGGGGGGGDRDKVEASAGRLPRAAMQQLAPPAAVIRDPDPALPVEPTVVMPNIAVAQPNLTQLGDPLGRLDGPPSNGTGFGGGVGSGSGGGVGSGRGPGVGPGFGGGIGGGIFRVGGGVSAPRAIYAPDPEFSEEARKAKHQGTVLLWVVISPDGRVRDMKVVRSLGMGLDQKALETVRTWRFEPAKKDGHPVAVQVNIEVNFRLY